MLDVRSTLKQKKPEPKVAKESPKKEKTGQKQTGPKQQRN